LRSSPWSRRAADLHAFSCFAIALGVDVRPHQGQAIRRMDRGGRRRRSASRLRSNREKRWSIVSVMACTS
jgi:hypothetical protein